MNILNNKNKRTSIFKALALCLFAAVSFTFVSCDDDMDIQQSYPFTAATDVHILHTGDVFPNASPQNTSCIAPPSQMVAAGR